MSIVTISVERLTAVEPHPNAERLEVAKLLGTQTVVPKGQYQPGDYVVFFPPDICLPGGVSGDLGVQKYLKHAQFAGLKIPCRVAACRLRGQPSYGFITPVPNDLSNSELGADVTCYYKAVKYEPPVSYTRFNGDLAPEHPAFHPYTDIQHFWKYSDVIKPDTWVRITEKIHGTNSRTGYIDGHYMAGSHKTNRKEYDAAGKLALYWRPLHEVPGLRDLLTSFGAKNVIAFGEIFGPKIQDLDYGVQGCGYRLFDVAVNGCYLNWHLLQRVAAAYKVPLVPLLYLGPFQPSLIEQFAHGTTTVSETVQSKFKGREGCVVTPVLEQWNDDIGRVILKSVSADYLDRKGAQDN